MPETLGDLVMPVSSVPPLDCSRMGGKMVASQLWFFLKQNLQVGKWKQTIVSFTPRIQCAV